MDLKTIWANEINSDCEIQLNSNTVLYIKDNIIEANPPVAKGLHKFFQEVGTPHCVISEVCFETDNTLSPVPIYSVPFRCMEILPVNFLKDRIPDHITTEYCFSFAVKKKAVHRHLLLKLIEYFGFASYLGTYDGNWRDFDLSRVIAELGKSNYTQDFKSFLLKPIAIDAYWIESPTDMSQVWYKGLDKICKNSAVHIITETLTWEKSAMFSEKALHAVLGLNFPLWIGGFGTAKAFERLGFDVFPDVIDHSYQYLPRLVDRCYQAISLNRRILEDLDYAIWKRNQCLPRLKSNWHHLFSGELQNINDEIVMSWPKPVREIVRPAMIEEREQVKQHWQLTGQGCV